MNFNMLLTDGASVQNFIHCYLECPYNSIAISYYRQHLHISIYLKHHSQPTSIPTPHGSTRLTTVMQSSWELHNIITYLHNLTQLASIMDASTPPMVIWALPYNSQGRWWKWGNNSMYRMCLQLAWWWLEYYPLWWKGHFRSAQCPQVGAFRVWFDIFSGFEHSILPIQKEGM